MDGGTIRIVCAVLAVLFIAVIVLRRRKKLTRLPTLVHAQ